MPFYLSEGVEVIIFPPWYWLCSPIYFRIIPSVLLFIFVSAALFSPSISNSLSPSADRIVRYRA